MNWIKVTDRLPEVDEYLESDVAIICYEDKMVSMGYFVKDGDDRWLDKLWHTRWENGEKLNVTHWMPLPEPASD